MQDRYAGDIGDFGKLGLLRKLGCCELAIGVNWYLTPDESHNTDGCHVGYLHKNEFQVCDEVLWSTLGIMVSSGKRTVSDIEKAELLSAEHTRYYNRELDFSSLSKQERQSVREKWHADALDTLSNCDIVFVDPDNGLIVRSAEGTAKSNKFVLPSEVGDYYRQGSSVIYYQHKARRTDSFYTKQHNRLLSSEVFHGAFGLGLKFRTTSQRYYFFILQPQHKDIISSCVGDMLETSWGKHFINITNMLY